MSVVIPAYNEEKSICRVAETINEVLNKENIPFDIVFVNDGSKDSTWQEICKLSKEKSSKSCRTFFLLFRQNHSFTTSAATTSAAGSTHVPCFPWQSSCGQMRGKTIPSLRSRSTLFGGHRAS